MKKKILALAIASSLAVPQAALAAEDTAGMHYTSASEGFYASIRAQLSSSSTKDQDADLGGGSSRFGVSGTNDLGGGMEGFYTYEAGVGIDNGRNPNSAEDGEHSTAVTTRLGNVGLRGGFGEIIAGTFWVNSYNWTYGSTDIANVNSGSLPYTAIHPGRQSEAVQYTSPDLNGFQVSGNVAFDGESANSKNDVDQWAISATYSIQGFSLGASYLVVADGLNKTITIPYTGTIAAPVFDVANTTSSNPDDYTSWVLKGGYSQDNWYVNAWYGQDSLGDTTVIFDHATNSLDRTVSFDDTVYFSIAGGVSIDKVSVYALYDNRELSARSGFASVTFESSLGTLGIQYNLGSRSRVFLEYASRDNDADATVDDNVVIGLRHDF